MLLFYRVVARSPFTLMMCSPVLSDRSSRVKLFTVISLYYKLYIPIYNIYTRHQIVRFVSLERFK